MDISDSHPATPINASTGSQHSEPEPGKAAPEHAPTSSTPKKLRSITQLDQEVGRVKTELMKLVEDRERLKDSLARSHQAYTQLGKQIHELTDQHAEKNRSVFVLLNKLDSLLQIQNRVKQRATELAQERRSVRQLSVSAAQDGADPSVDLRSHERRPLAIEVGLQGETNFYVGFTEDISEGGVFVATYQTQPVGTRFPVQFKLPGHPEPVHCIVEVAWVREFRENENVRGVVPGMGLRFAGLATEDRDIIATFLDKREPLFFPELDEFVYS